jgi:DnaJ-class molecular chaperone
MDFKDYYATLGVAKTASAKEIKQAFRKLARKYHPDVNQGNKAAESKFKEINEASEVLGDPGTRQKYDELGSNWKMYEHRPSPGRSSRSARRTPPSGHDGGFRTMSPDEMNEAFGETGSFSDFFTTFFGGGEPRTTSGRGRQSAGRDVEHEIQLSLEDAYAGTTRRLGLERDGQLRHVEVRIPAGVRDASRVRVPSEGEPGPDGGASGHLYLRVKIAPHPTFELKDKDLYVTASLPVTTAVLGGEAEVQTLAGKPARLRVPPLTQNGQVFRLKGYGMPATGSATASGTDRGDLYARVEVRLPAELSADEREHYTELARLHELKTAPPSESL